MADVTRPDHSNPCSICGRTAVAKARGQDGAERWLSYDHLPDNAREMYDALREVGWPGELIERVRTQSASESPPPKSHTGLHEEEKASRRSDRRYYQATHGRAEVEWLQQHLGRHIVREVALRERP